MSTQDPIHLFGHFIRRLFLRVRLFLISTLSIKEGTDIEATIIGLKKDIVFRGPTAWILMFSIFIASIGLNVNSIAVIIGAMLISPLMGPILGIGLALGTNDWETLLKSLKNFGIAIGLGLATSAVYFALTPLDFVQSEILNRTKPTILDVMLALFGGLAGIIAGSRREKSNVVPGVAIATALMPPLCVAGYGLANFEVKFFLGAFYLFFINSVFIALSTYLVVRYLKFPKVQTLDERKARQYRYGLYFFLLITILPSVMIFWSVIQETRYEVNAEKFINENCRFEGSELITKKVTYSDTISIIDLYYIGQPVSEAKQLNLEIMLDQYKLSGKGLFSPTDKTKIIFHQDEDKRLVIREEFEDMNKELRASMLQEIYKKNEALILDKDKKIQLLESELMKMRTLGVVPMSQMQKELKFQFENVEKFSFANVVEVTGEDKTLKTDTIASLLVNFNEKLNSKKKAEEIKRIEDWLKIRFQKERVQVLEY